jgi:hypothetical protein
VVTTLKGADLPKCTGCTDKNLVILHDDSGIEHYFPMQLTEYTLGAIIDAPRNDKLVLNPYNVDYDVSYVDTAFLPVAMEPFDNDQVGYVGMVSTIEDFNAAVTKFLGQKQYTGWPLFVTPDGTTVQKVPSPLNLFGRDLSNPPKELTAPPWAPIDSLRTDYIACVQDNKSGDRCDSMRQIQKLFDANFKAYTDNFDKWNCNDKFKAKGDTASMLGHFYGWTPFNEGCGDAKLNLLENTVGYVENNYKNYFAVKQMYDDLQYEKSGQFDPYVLLIHGKDYINAPNVYAYSVDDAVGNMQVDGGGLILAVGGPGGLPNPDPATPPIHVSFGGSANDKVNYTDYGICRTDTNRKVNPDYRSFDVSLNKIKNCTLTLKDDNGRTYQFQITQQPPFPGDAKPTDATRKMVDCSFNKDSDALKSCQQNAYGYTVLKSAKEMVNTISYPPPVQPAAKAFVIVVGGDPKDKNRFVKRGICTTKPDTDFMSPGSFNLPFDKAKGCTISLLDQQNKVYMFQIKTDKAPFPKQQSKDVIDCSVNTDADAKKQCLNFAQGYSEGSGDQVVNYVVFPQPIQPTAPAPGGDFIVSVDGGRKDKVRYVEIGICSETPDTKFKSPGNIKIKARKAEGCVMSLRDEKDRIYRFGIKAELAPFPEKPTASVIDCAVNDSSETRKWCEKFARGFSKGSGDKLVNKVILPAPIQSGKKSTVAVR